LAAFKAGAALTCSRVCRPELLWCCAHIEAESMSPSLASEMLGVPDTRQCPPTPAELTDQGGRDILRLIGTGLANPQSPATGFSCRKRPSSITSPISCRNCRCAARRAALLALGPLRRPVAARGAGLVWAAAVKVLFWAFLYNQPGERCETHAMD
jgi:hypothetical protein